MQTCLNCSEHRSLSRSSSSSTADTLSLFLFPPRSPKNDEPTAFLTLFSSLWNTFFVLSASTFNSSESRDDSKSSEERGSILVDGTAAGDAVVKAPVAAEVAVATGSPIDRLIWLEDTAKALGSSTCKSDGFTRASCLICIKGRYNSHRHVLLTSMHG